MKNKILWTGSFVLGLLILIQFVPVERTNPDEDGVVPAPDKVMTLLEKACFDCHSNRTEWPWYSRVAPVSWLVASDVKEGRHHVNFTAWDRLNRNDRIKVLGEIRDMVSEGDMPPAIYRLGHSEARLADEQRDTIVAWTRQTEGSEDVAPEE